MKRVQPTYEEISPGEWRIRIPADYDGYALPDEIIALQAAFALRHADPAGARSSAPAPGSHGSPMPSGPERRRLHQKQRLVALQRQAVSQKALDAFCDNEGLPRVTWIDRGQRVREQKRRLARERTAHYRPFEG